jgi:hypothetical protein
VHPFTQDVLGRTIRLSAPRLPTTVVSIAIRGDVIGDIEAFRDPGDQDLEEGVISGTKRT